MPLQGYPSRRLKATVTVLQPESILLNERVITSGAGITFIDHGPELPMEIHTDSTVIRDILVQTILNKTFLECVFSSPIINWSITTVTTNYTVLDEDFAILADATSGPITVTLPAASVGKRQFIVKKIDNSSNKVTVASSSLIDGFASYDLKIKNSSILTFSNETTYYIV